MVCISSYLLPFCMPIPFEIPFLIKQSMLLWLEPKIDSQIGKLTISTISQTNFMSCAQVNQIVPLHLVYI